MGEESSVKLYGFWGSPYAMRANIALRVKGIDFEYVQENLTKKSELLLKYNHVHKKVPVLVHNDQPVVESLVILEYLDEAWPATHNLLPKDPYLKSKYRFWADYLEPTFVLMRKILATEGEAQRTTITELLEKLDVAEEGIAKDIYPNGVPSFQEVKPGYLDIVFYSLFGTYEAAEEFFGNTFLAPERYPLLVSWVKELSQVPEVEQVTPPRPKMLGFFEFIRRKYLPAKA